MADNTQNNQWGVLFLLKDVIGTAIFLYLWLVRGIPFWTLIAWFYGLALVGIMIFLIARFCLKSKKGARAEPPQCRTTVTGDNNEVIGTNGGC